MEMVETIVALLFTTPMVLLVPTVPMELTLLITLTPVMPTRLVSARPTKKHAHTNHTTYEQTIYDFFKLNGIIL